MGSRKGGGGARFDISIFISSVKPPARKCGVVATSTVGLPKTTSQQGDGAARFDIEVLQCTYEVYGNKNLGYYVKHVYYCTYYGSRKHWYYGRYTCCMLPGLIEIMVSTCRVPSTRYVNRETLDHDPYVLRTFSQAFEVMAHT